MFSKKMLGSFALTIMTLSGLSLPVFADANYSEATFFGHEGNDARFDRNFSKTAKITDFDKLMVGVSSSPYASVDGTFFIGGLANSSGTHFQTVVMNRTPEQMEENRMQAVDYFQERFGVNALDSSRVAFVGFEMLKDLDYRIVVASEDKVPNSGWRINDGGWVAIVWDPSGYDLKDGRHVPPGTMFAYGDYMIERSSSNPLDKKNIRFGYRSVQPIIQQADGSFLINCEAFSEKLGIGRILGAAQPMQLANGKFGMNSRVVITFSTFGDQIDAANKAQK